jgi:hypothetical protein
VCVVCVCVSFVSLSLSLSVIFFQVTLFICFIMPDLFDIFLLFKLLAFCNIFNTRALIFITHLLCGICAPSYLAAAWSTNSRLALNLSFVFPVLFCSLCFMLLLIFVRIYMFTSNAPRSLLAADIVLPLKVCTGDGSSYDKHLDNTGANRLFDTLIRTLPDRGFLRSRRFDVKSIRCQGRKSASPSFS